MGLSGPKVKKIHEKKKPWVDRPTIVFKLKLCGIIFWRIKKAYIILKMSKT
jgi:hypothetical protein